MKIDQAFVDAAAESFKKMLTRAMEAGAEVTINLHSGLQPARNPTQDQWSEWEYSGDESIYISFRTIR